MKNFFVVSLFILLQYQCMSSEDSQQQENNLLQTHKVEIEDNGDKIFYPKEYENYNDFKEKYIEKVYVKTLLYKRLGILDSLLKELSNNKKENNDYYKNLLSRNKYAIIASSKKGEFDPNIFDIEYDERSIKDHATKVSSILKSKFSGENHKPK